MLPVIEKLLVLQDRDRKLIRLRAELAAVPVQRQLLLARTAKTAAELEAARTRAKQIESDRKKLELEVDTLKQRIAKVQTEQQATRSNDQYKAFQHQVETTQGEISQLEDRQLELMEQADAAAVVVKTAGAAAAEVKAETDKQVGDLAEREKNLQAEHDRIDAERDGLADGIDEGALAKYERLLKSRGDSAVVSIAKGICGGCHMKLPMQVFVSTKGQQEIVTCPNCSRILYYTSDMESPVGAE